MPDDARLNRQFERHYAEQRRDDVDDAQAALAGLDVRAQALLRSIEDAAATHREFDEDFRAAAQALRDCWHDIRGDLEGTINRQL